MYPHERSLVETYRNRPFAIVGVNSDSDMAKLREVRAKEGITWRSFRDGRPPGPIADAWNVSGWPTVYLIDHRGVIRAVNPEGSALDAAIGDLVEKAEGDRRR